VNFDFSRTEGFRPFPRGALNRGATVGRQLEAPPHGAELTLRMVFPVRDNEERVQARAGVPCDAALGCARISIFLVMKELSSTPSEVALQLTQLAAGPERS